MKGSLFVGSYRMICMFVLCLALKLKLFWAYPVISVYLKRFNPLCAGRKHIKQHIRLDVDFYNIDFIFICIETYLTYIKTVPFILKTMAMENSKETFCKDAPEICLWPTRTVKLYANFPHPLYI